MKKLLGVILLLVVGSAQAATVQTAACFEAPNGICATGITGLVVGAQTYNVDFNWDSFGDLNVGNNFPFIGDQLTAELARDAINVALNASSATRILDGNIEYSAYFIPFELEIPFEDGAAISETGGGWGGASWFDASGSTPNFSFIDNMYATFTVVPVPAAVWLFGSGLGLLGWIRRRQTT